MLDAVDWANRRLERLGLGHGVCAVIVSFGYARLMSYTTGRELDMEPCEDDPAAAVRILMLRLEIGILFLLQSG